MSSEPEAQRKNYGKVWNPNDGPEPPNLNGKPTKSFQPGTSWNPNDGPEPPNFKAQQKQQQQQQQQQHSQPHESSNPPPPSYESSVGPNIALNMDFLRREPVNLIMEGHATSNDFTIKDEVGHQLFEVEGSTFSASHQMQVIHAPSRQHLFVIRKEAFSMSWRYSAEIPPEGSGQTLFETETHSGFFSSGTTFMTFRNAVTGQQDRLEVELHRTSGPNEVLYRGERIADIDRTTLSWSPTYTIYIHLPGVDPLLCVVLALVINDRLKTQRRRRN